MKNNHVGVLKRLASAILVTATIVGVSTIAVHTPNSKPNLLARPFKSIQTDKVILFDGSAAPVIAAVHVTVQGPPITGESRDATEHLKKAVEPFLIATAHVTVQGPPITGESRDATEHLKKAVEPFLIASSHVTVQGPPITGESRDATEHLKLVAQAF